MKMQLTYVAALLAFANQTALGNDAPISSNSSPVSALSSEGLTSRTTSSDAMSPTGAPATKIKESAGRQYRTSKSSLTRAEVSADLQIYQESGLAAIERHDSVDYASKSYVDATAKYSSLRWSPYYAELVMRHGGPVISVEHRPSVVPPLKRSQVLADLQIHQESGLATLETRQSVDYNSTEYANAQKRYSSLRWSPHYVQLVQRFGGEAEDVGKRPPVAPALTRAEVKADLQIFQESGLAGLHNAQTVDYQSHAFAVAQSRYEELRSSPYFTELVQRYRGATAMVAR